MSTCISVLSDTYTLHERTTLTFPFLFFQQIQQFQQCATVLLQHKQKPVNFKSFQSRSKQTDRQTHTPLVDEGVEAGEDEQRHHGAQRHHIVELGRQDVLCVGGLRRLIG